MEMKKRLHFGVLLTTLDNSCQYDIWNGIVRYASKNDIHLTAYLGTYQTTSYDFTSHYETCLNAIVNNKSLDGMIVLSGFIAGEVSNEAVGEFVSKIANRLPIVSVSYVIPGIRSVLADNFAGIYEAVDHLIQAHGKRKIAFVKGPEGHPEAEDRFEGYKMALVRNGIAFDERYVFPGDFSDACGQLAVDTLLKAPDFSADAIVACDDATAMGVLSGLKKHGLLVPADIAVTGFDDERDSATYIPSISTARQDFFEIGQISAEALHDQIYGKPAEDITYVSPVFMMRQSCGCMDTGFTDAEQECREDLAGTESLVSYVTHHFTSLFQTDVPAALIDEWAIELSEIVKEKPFSKKKFLCLLNEYFVRYHQYFKTISIWDEALDVLSKGIQLHCDEIDCVNIVLFALNQGSKLVNDFRFNEGKIREFAIYDERVALRRIASKLASLYDFGTLVSELHQSLPEVLIHTAIIGLYQRSIKSADSGANRTISTLIGFREEKEFNMSGSNNPILFSDYSTIKALDFESERRTLLFLPLFFEDEEYGTMLIPFDHMVSVETYETLRVNISTAVKGAELIREIEYRNDLLDAMNGAAAILLEPDVDKFEENIVAALGVVAKALNVSRMNIWQNHECCNEPYAAVLHEWDADETAKPANDIAAPVLYGSEFAQWWDTLIAGKCINNFMSERPQCERERLSAQKIVSFAVAPVIMNNHFWGFVGFYDHFKERRFSENEEMVLRSVSKLIANALLRQEMARNLQTSLEQVVEASKAKSDFLSNMSHEMRTPMNAIIGMTSIGEKARDTDEKNHAFSKIKDASSHLLGVINDVLDVSKIEANKLELDWIEFDFQRMLQKVITVIHFRLEEKKQIFSIHIDPQIPHFVVGDSQRMAQVITNLLSNAVKFTPMGGRIALAAELVGIHEGMCELRVEVTDNGIGIAPEKQEKIFEPFEQAESGTSRVYGGTGLGLVITKRIIELMKGRIWVESELGKGAKFIFTAHLQIGQNSPRSLLAPGVNWENVRILAVDDDSETRVQFQEVFDTLNIQCDVALDGHDARSMIERHGYYDIYFVDWLMPRMDGIELTRYIKSRGDGKSSVVIMITAKDWNQFKQDAAQAGVDKHLLKPLLSSSILDTLNDCLGITHEQNSDTSGVDSRFTGRKMLLAEDIDINREILLSVLEETGIEIDCAVNGREAFEMVAANPLKYDIVFMDIQMPIMDGYEATRSIRMLPTMQDTKLPIIAMTANVFKSDIESCLAAGMNEHLGKPLDVNRVFEVLRKYL